MPVIHWCSLRHLAASSAILSQWKTSHGSPMLSPTFSPLHFSGQIRTLLYNYSAKASFLAVGAFDLLWLCRLWLQESFKSQSATITGPGRDCLWHCNKSRRTSWALPQKVWRIWRAIRTHKNTARNGCEWMQVAATFDLDMFDSASSTVALACGALASSGARVAAVSCLPCNSKHVLFLAWKPGPEMFAIRVVSSRSKDTSLIQNFWTSEANSPESAHVLHPLLSVCPSCPATHWERVTHHITRLSGIKLRHMTHGSRYLGQVDNRSSKEPEQYSRSDVYPSRNHKGLSEKQTPAPKQVSRWDQKHREIPRCCSAVPVTRGFKKNLVLDLSHIASCFLRILGAFLTVSSNCAAFRGLQILLCRSNQANKTICLQG